MNELNLISKMVYRSILCLLMTVQLSFRNWHSMEQILKTPKRNKLLCNASGNTNFITLYEDLWPICCQIENWKYNLGSRKKAMSSISHSLVGEYPPGSIFIAKKMHSYSFFKLGKGIKQIQLKNCRIKKGIHKLLTHKVYK